MRTRRLVATMRPLDAAMGYLVRRDKHVVNGGVVCAVGAWCGADALSSMFVDGLHILSWNDRSCVIGAAVASEVEAQRRRCMLSDNMGCNRATAEEPFKAIML
jgi:hypothetical protein